MPVAHDNDVMGNLSAYHGTGIAGKGEHQPRTDTRHRRGSIHRTERQIGGVREQPAMDLAAIHGARKDSMQFQHHRERI